MYVPDLKPMCDLDLNTVLFEIKNPYRRAKNPYRRAKILTGAQILQAHRAPVRAFCAPVRILISNKTVLRSRSHMGFRSGTYFLP